MRVLGVCGSLRQHSYNRLLLEAAARKLPEEVDFEIMGGIVDLPAYSEDAEGEFAPARVRTLRALLAGADAILVSTPEYNASPPGALKNALDWASRPFPDNALRAKPTVVIGASTSLFGAVWAQAALRKVLAAAGAHVSDGGFALPEAHRAFDTSGRLIDTEIDRRLAETVTHLFAGANAASDRRVARG